MQGLSFFNAFNGDRSLAALLKLVFFICVLLMFGMILNGITTTHELRISKNEKQTELRIALIREEYDRKLSEKDEKCKQKICRAKEEQNTLQKKIQEQFNTELKNKENEIERLKLQLKEPGSKLENPDALDSKEQSDLAIIEKQLVELKAKIHSRQAGMKEDGQEKSHDSDEISLKEAEFYVADRKLLADLTQKYRAFKDEKKESSQ